MARDDTKRPSTNIYRTTEWQTVDGVGAMQQRLWMVRNTAEALRGWFSVGCDPERLNLRQPKYQHAFSRCSLSDFFSTGRYSQGPVFGGRVKTQHRRTPYAKHLFPLFILFVISCRYQNSIACTCPMLASTVNVKFCAWAHSSSDWSWSWEEIDCLRRIWQLQMVMSC